MLNEILWDDTFIRAILDNPFFDPTEGDTGEDDKGSKDKELQQLSAYLMRYADLTFCRSEPGSLLVEKLDLECTKNNHDGDIVYFG